MRLNLQADCCSPWKARACLHLTLPISFQFTKAFLESWLHVGSLNMTIPISWSPEVGRVHRILRLVCTSSSWPRASLCKGSSRECECDHSLFALREAGRLPILIADSSSSTGRGMG